MGGGRKKSCFLISALLLGLICCVPQAAQAQKNSVLPIRVKLGVLLPSDRDTRNLVGNTHRSGEIDVGLPFAEGNRQQLRLSVGVSLGSRRRDGLNTGYTVVPVSLTSIRLLPKPLGKAAGEIYYGVGVGVYFTHASGLLRYIGQGEGSVYQVYSKKRTLLGTSLVAGYQMRSSFFVEGKYHIVVGTVDGYSPNGLSLFIGKRL